MILLKIFLFALVLAVTACASSEGQASDKTSNTPDLSNVELKISSPTEFRLLATLAEIQEAVPFEIVIPDVQSLSENFELRFIHAELPLDRIAQPGRDRAISVNFSYGNTEYTAGFQMQEGLMPNSVGLPDLTSVDVRLANGQEVDVEIREDPARKILAATWSDCDIEFLLSGSPLGGLTHERVAELVQGIGNQCI